MGFAVDPVHSGLDELWQANETPYGAYGVLILDRTPPDLDGHEICRTLRIRQVSTPVPMVTAKDGERDRADAFAVGTDDDVTKPCSLLVLTSRLRALARSGAPECREGLTARDLTLDPGGRRVTQAGTRCHGDAT